MLSDWQIFILLGLSFADTILTYHWAKACLKWKSTLTLDQLESNKFVVLCWNNFGLLKGSFISGVMLFGIQFGLSSIHTYIFYIIVAILVFASLNHIHNFIVLDKRVKKEEETKNEIRKKVRADPKYQKASRDLHKLLHRKGVKK